MKNILVLASTYPRWENDTEPAFVDSLCRELAREHKVHVLVPHFRNAAINEKNNNVTVYRFRYFLPGLECLAYEGGILSNLRKNRLNYLLVPLFILFQFISLCMLHRKFKYDVVHAHWLIPQGFLAVVARQISRNKYKIFVTSHGGDLYALNTRLFRKLKSWIVEKADKITVVSEAMRVYCKKLNINTDKITVCSMGVDLRNTFIPKIPYMERNGIIFVGRLVEKKGVVYLINAMKEIIKKYPSTRLCVVGDGPDRNFLEKLAGENNINQNISFVGSVPNHEVPGYLNRARIAVMPSVVSGDGDQEGLGLVAVEAMGCGCTVVASDLPAVRDVIIDGITGIMATPASSVSLADAITGLLANGVMAESIAKRGHEYVLEKFDWEIIGNKYSRMIENL